MPQPLPYAIFALNRQGLLPLELLCNDIPDLLRSLPYFDETTTAKATPLGAGKICVPERFRRRILTLHSPGNKGTNFMSFLSVQKRFRHSGKQDYALSRLLLCYRAQRTVLYLLDITPFCPLIFFIMQGNCRNTPITTFVFQQ